MINLNEPFLTAKDFDGKYLQVAGEYLQIYDSRSLAAIANARVAPLVEALKIAREALKHIENECGQFMPNSGHSYLAVTNECYGESKDALSKIKEILK